MQWGIPNVTLIELQPAGRRHRRTLRERQQHAPVGRQFLVDPRQAHLPLRRRVPPRALQPGRKPVRARAVHVSAQCHAESGRRKTGGDTFADFLLGDLYQSEAAVSIASAKFRRNALGLLHGRHLEGHAEVDAGSGLALRNDAAVLRHAATSSRSPCRTMDRTPNVADQSPLSAVHPSGPCSGDPYAGIAHSLAADRARLRRPAGRSPGADRPQRFRTAHRHHLFARARSGWSAPGGGMFYNQDTGNPRFDMARNIAGRIRVNSALQNPTLFWSNALSNISGGVANITLPYAFANKYERRTPYYDGVPLNMQRQFASRRGASRSAIWAPSAASWSSCAPSTNRCRAPSARPRRASPYPNFGRIQLVDNSANGAYNSLAVKLTKRFSQGFTLLSSYTWSKSMDDSSGIRVQGQDTLFPQNSYCRKCEWALSAYDTRHRFVTSALVRSAGRQGPACRRQESICQRGSRRMADRRHLDRAERFPDHADCRRHRSLGHGRRL